MDTNKKVLKERLDNLLYFKNEFQKMKLSNNINQMKNLVDLMKNEDITSLYESVKLNNKSYGFVENILNEKIIDIESKIKSIERDV